jgi:peptidyl-prolyl cis-trans isomerase SurA
MQKIVFLTLSSLAGLMLQAQVLFTYGKKQVTKQEFLSAFNKNPNSNSSRKEGLKEYRELYPNYKLKVQSAYDEKLNEDPSFLAEVNNFKRQITENVINEEANINLLVDEAFKRSQKDLDIAQIFIGNNNEGSEMAKINLAYAQLKKGVSFDSVLQKFCSDEMIKANKGSIGFITAFTLPYEIENLVYTTKVGGYTLPYKSNYGWHIFKINSERPAIGKRKMAQILIAIPPNPTQEDLVKAETQINQLYNKVKAGEDFGEVAKQNSADYNTAGLGGDMGEVGVGRFDKDFENRIFAMKAKGEITTPFKTPYGFHILKLVEILPVPKDANEPNFAAALKQRVENSERLSVAKKNLIKKWMVQTKFRRAFYNEQQVFEFTDSSWQNKIKPAFGLVNDNTVLFSFEKQDVKLSEFAGAVKTARFSGGELAKKGMQEILKDFEETKCAEYYRNYIDEYNPSMKQQLKEFSEGNLLFAAMDKMVWQKSNDDSIGLLKTYTTNKAKFNWQPGVSAVVISANSKEVAEELHTKLKNNFASWRDSIAAKGATASADSGRFEYSQLPTHIAIQKQVGFISQATKSPSDDSYSFVYITQLHNNIEQRSFEDARGLVMAEYQKIIEKEWLASLKRKYPIKFSEAVWATIK